MSKGITQEKKNGLYELTPEMTEQLKESKYYNKDLAPTVVSERNWTTLNICNLWIT